MKFYTLGLKGLPFTPDPKQIIYVESSYNHQVNRFIRRNYRVICRHFSKLGYDFCYLPLLHRKLNKEVCSYYDPTTKYLRLCPMESDFLLQYMARPQNRQIIEPSLVYVVENLDVQDDEDLAVRGVVLEDLRWRNRTLKQFLSAITNDIYGHKTPIIRYRVKDSLYNQVQFCIDCPKDQIERIEERFDIETLFLMREVEDKIRRLRQKGISQYVLESMVLEPPTQISPIVITSDYRIILPEYKKMEIKMTPLVKAVYLLFLRYPEGIIFKHLPDYREELKELYEKVKGGTLDEKMLQSVEVVTDPTNNSINEKCARIREAFVARFDERLAVNYIVQGNRGEPKRIPIDRNLVEWK